MSGNNLIKYPTILIILISLLACGKITTTYSTLIVENTDERLIHGIVQSALSSLGEVHFGDMSLKKKRPFEIYRMNPEGKKQYYIFYVSFKIFPEKISILIEIINLGASQEELKYDSIYLNEVTRKIEDMLNAAHIEANIETKSYWVPSMHCL